MSSLFDVLNTVSNALENSEGFDLSEIDKEMAKLHSKLTETKWAIEEEMLRSECEELLVQWVFKRYLTEELKDK